MERRALLAVVLSLLVLVTWEQGMRYFHPAPVFDGTAELPPDLAPPPVPEGEAVEAAPPAESARPAEAAPAQAAAPTRPERLVTVETPLYSATFSSRGARLVSFRTKYHRTGVAPGSPPQELVLPGKGVTSFLPVELRGPGAIPTISDTDVDYEAGEDVQLGAGQEAELDFSTRIDGVELHKRFTFRADHYLISARLEAEGLPKGYNELLVSWSRPREEASRQSEKLFEAALLLQGGKRKEKPFSELEQGELFEGEVRWTGYTGRHFFAGLAVDEELGQRLWIKHRGSILEQRLLVPVSGHQASIPLEMYLGPKDVDLLESAGHGFERAIDLGYFGFVAVPLLHVLQFSHRFTGNYGFDIILLTVLIKILFLPLTRKSFESMQAMQKLQPQMQELRERLKDKPEQMNREVMELYRRHKVNPLGGCLPMLLQLPVFIGLYTALMNAVELRHAPFLLWIHDLAAPDRLGNFALPFVEGEGIPVMTLLMGASMFAQQWMTPSSADPSQRMVMMLMPVMFTAMFVNFPAGLTLYWLVNNVLTIAQQGWMLRASQAAGASKPAGVPRR